MIISLVVVLVLGGGVAWRLRPRPKRMPPPALPKSLDALTIAQVGAAYQKDIEPIFKRSCFDCHSRNTDFPWYHAIPGVRQYLDGHIEEGRHDLELSEGFPFNQNVHLMRHLRRISRVVKTRDMPLWDYALLHKNARLSDADRALIVRWAEDGLQDLGATAKY